MAYEDEGGSPWKMILGAIVAVATLVGGFFLAKKNNWFGLGASTNSGSTPNAGGGGSAAGGQTGDNPPPTQPAPTTQKFGVFSGGMSLDDARKNIPASTDETFKPRMNLMIDFLASQGKQTLGWQEITLDSKQAAFKEDALLLFGAGQNSPKGRYFFINMVSIEQLANMKTLGEAQKYFPKMPQAEFDAMRSYLGSLQNVNVKEKLTQEQFKVLVTNMRAANPNWDKAAATAISSEAAAAALKAANGDITPAPVGASTAPLPAAAGASAPVVVPAVSAASR